MSLFVDSFCCVIFGADVIQFIVSGVCMRNLRSCVPYIKKSSQRPSQQNHSRLLNVALLAQNTAQ